jgi:serine/threonine-protein kinase
MTQNRPMPSLVARFTDPAGFVAALRAAVMDGVAYAPLDRPPMTMEPHVLAIYAPNVAPIVVRADPAGAPANGMYPLALHPLSDEDRGILLAMLSAAEPTSQRMPSSPRAPGPQQYQQPHYQQPQQPQYQAQPQYPQQPMYQAQQPAQQQLSPPPSQAQPSERAPLEGRTLGNGKYLVEGLLGAGGMGNVYRARHVALDRPVAVKVLHKDYQRDPSFVSSFHREALAVSRLDHPNIVRVLDFGQEPDGLLYIVMELLAGMDLRQVLEAQGRLPLPRIVDVMSQVAAALAAAHDQGIVHRDIKPDNIRLIPTRDEEGRSIELVKLCDFGMADVKGIAGSMGGGTPDYVSPEQARSLPASPASDIYSCGVVLFELATGQLPFGDVEGLREILMAHVNREAPAPSRIEKRAAPLDDIVLRAMRKDPTRRQQNARVLRTDLRAVISSAGEEGPSFRREERESYPIEIADAHQRQDAIEIGSLLGDAPSRPKVNHDDARAHADQVAAALAHDTRGVLAQLDAITDLGLFGWQMSALAPALRTLCERAAVTVLWPVTVWLVGRSRGAEPSDDTLEGHAARAIKEAFAYVDVLVPVAMLAIDGQPATRDGAKGILVALGGTGAAALCAARENAGLSQASRPRFVSLLRDLGPVAQTALVAALRRRGPTDPIYAEDLLRGIAEAAEDPAPPSQVARAVEAQNAAAGPMSARAPTAGAVIATFLEHTSPAVRRAACGALAAVAGSREAARIEARLVDPDDSVRLAAVKALRRAGAIDGSVVHSMAPFVTGSSSASDELKTAMAAALGEAAVSARKDAASILAEAVRPSQSFFAKLVPTESRENADFLETAARALLSLGGREAGTIIEARAQRCGPELRTRLLDLLRSGR